MYDESAKAVEPSGRLISDAVKNERSAIEAELNRLHEALGYQEDLISILGKRVSPVSYQEPEAEEQGALQEPRGGSQFYSVIWDAVNRVERLHQKTQSITRKLEV